MKLKKINLSFHIKLRIENWDEMLFWLETINYNSLTIIFMQSTSSTFTEAEAAGEILFVVSAICHILFKLTWLETYLLKYLDM